MSAVARKLNESLKKQTQFPISFLQSETTFWAGSQVFVENITLGEKDIDNDYEYDENNNDDDDDDDDDVFFINFFL